MLFRMWRRLGFVSLRGFFSRVPFFYSVFAFPGIFPIFRRSVREIFWVPNRYLQLRQWFLLLRLLLLLAIFLRPLRTK